MVAARHVGIQRLGQQLFSGICCPHDRHSGNTNRRRIGLGPWRCERRRDFESRDRVLGNFQLQENSQGFAESD